jgi:hypothetical protein
MWSNQLSSGRITLQLKRFLFHIYNGAREEFISFPCRSYCAAWLFGLSAGDGAEQKWMILACISQPHYRPKCRAARWCVRSFIRPIISCQLNERAQKRVGVCAHNAMHARKSVVFFLAQPVWRILGYTV